MCRVAKFFSLFILRAPLVLSRVSKAQPESKKKRWALATSLPFPLTYNSLRYIVYLVAKREKGTPRRAYGS